MQARVKVKMEYPSSCSVCGRGITQGEECWLVLYCADDWNQELLPAQTMKQPICLECEALRG